MKLLSIIILLNSINLFSQHLIYTTNRSIIECEIDTTTFSLDNITYKRYDRAGYFQMKKSQILFIKDFKGNFLFPKEVVGIESSKRLHLPNSTHYSRDENKKVFPNIDAGQKEGYSICNACFDFSSPLPDQQIENILAQQALVDTRLYCEILYEDKRLEHVNSVLKKVLYNWPEEKRGFKYRVQIYRGEPNAFAIPGGNLIISDGMLDLIESDLELEAVLAHEVAHVEKRHQLRQYYFIQNQKTIGFMAGFISLIFARAAGEKVSAESIFNLTNLITDIVVNIRKNGYSREIEEEADLMALLYFQKQSMSLVPMKNIWGKLADYTFNRGSDLYNTNGDHPSTMKRITQIEQSETTILKQPIIFECQENISVDKTKIKVVEVSPHFNFEIKVINLMPSSTENNQMQLSFIGHIDNELSTNSYRIKEIVLTSVKNNIEIKLEGSENFLLPNLSRKEYFFKSTLDFQKAKILKSVLDTRANMDLKLNVERINVERNGKIENIIYSEVKFSVRKII
jgi:hypothetical protein